MYCLRSAIIFCNAVKRRGKTISSFVKMVANIQSTDKQIRDHNLEKGPISFACRVAVGVTFCDGGKGQGNLFLLVASTIRPTVV